MKVLSCEIMPDCACTSNTGGQSAEAQTQMSRRILVAVKHEDSKSDSKPIRIRFGLLKRLQRRFDDLNRHFKTCLTATTVALLQPWFIEQSLEYQSLFKYVQNATAESHQRKRWKNKAEDAAADKDKEVEKGRIIYQRIIFCILHTIIVVPPSSSHRGIPPFDSYNELEV